MALTISDDVDFNDGGLFIYQINTFAQEMTVYPSLFPNGDYPVQKPGSSVDKSFAGELRGAFGHKWHPAGSLLGAARDGGRIHTGVDIYAPFVPLPMGTQIVASVKGRLTYLDESTPDGKDGKIMLAKRLHLAFAFKGKNYRLIYGHLAGTAKRTGEVNPGEIIGYAGCSGNANFDGMCLGTNNCGMTTAHVHIALIDDTDQKYVNPLPALGWKLRYQDDKRNVDCAQAWS
jgi:murein DD-endopeptidase MepM/ murein hydrolase activator NlpD